MRQAREKCFTLVKRPHQTLTPDAEARGSLWGDISRGLADYDRGLRKGSRGGGRA